MPFGAGSTLANSIFVRAVALGLVYWLTVVLAIELVSPVDKIALFWPPNAIAAVVLIFGSRKHWPLYLFVMALAYFAGRIPSGHFPLYVYFGFCAANIIEVLIVAELVRRLVPEPITHQALTKVLPVALLASVPATIVSALTGGAFITSAIERATFWSASFGWFTGDLSGLVLVLPVLLCWLAPGAPSIKFYSKIEIIERTGIAAIFAAIGFLVIAYMTEEKQISLIFPYLVFPVLIWTAIRLGIRSVTAATLTVGLFAILLTYLGQGPFGFEGLSAFGQVVMMKSGLIIITITTIFLATVVADRKKGEEALKESNRLFRAAFDQNAVGMAIRDVGPSDSRWRRVNQKFCDVFGYTREEMLQMTSIDVSPPEERHTAVEFNERILRGKISNYSREKLYMRKDGHLFWSNIWLSPIFGSDGVPNQIIQVIEDITERKQAEEALLESEDLLNSIIENVPVALLIKDSDHVVERANSTYLSWYGFDADTMMNRRSDEIKGFQPAEEVEKMNAQEREVLTTGKTLVRQVERPFADGQIHTINITKFPVYDQQGNITKVGSVGFDLTEQVQANKAKSEFMAAMSHDLRTPLNAIIGFSDFISQQYFGPIGDKYQEYAKDIKSSGEFLLSLVNDILDLSAIESGQQPLSKENISITDVVTECEIIIKERAQSLGLDLVIKVPKDPPPLYADRRAIMQILLNLLSNSVKFTPEGGKVTLRAAATNEHHTIEVSDTGRGIAADRIATITDPFVKGETDPHKTQESTGLGLAIVKSLVELHDGELDIKSTVGKGTTVTVKLPN